jgi:hypothetical protein
VNTLSQNTRPKIGDLDRCASGSSLFTGVHGSFRLFGETF